jgi:ABC-type glutathione transport system ATPase component
LLVISGLRVCYGAQEQSPALGGVSLEIAAGEILGVLGESGCGKSTLALSILGVLPAAASIAGSIKFRGEELVGLPEPKLRAIRGAKISLIHQEPGLCLSPVMRVGNQICEIIRAHRSLPREQLRPEATVALAEAGLPDPERVYHSYPHQLSGGELNRVVIAQALSCRPDLLIADEPTRSLDAAVQAEVLDLFRELNRKLNTAILFITHNPALLARLASRVLVMHYGQVVEEGPLAHVFGQPQHGYTRRLLQLVPQSLTLQSMTAKFAAAEKRGHKLAYGA